MAWLDTVPDGSTVQFGAGRCYGQDGTITLTDRKGLVIDGQGSEFRALTPGEKHRANWRFVGGSDLTVRNMAVRGSNPDGLYEPAIEKQHGYSLEGVQGIRLSNVKARETWGDGVYLGKRRPSACGDPASSTRNVLITRALLERNGRQGVAVVDAEWVTLQDSTVGPVAWANVDIEPDVDCQIARHITVARNSFGANGTGVIDNPPVAGGNPQVGDVRVIDNVQTEPIDSGILAALFPCRAPVQIRSRGRLPRRLQVAGNRFIARDAAFIFTRVRNIKVTSNTVIFRTPISGCNNRAGVYLTDSHTVGIIDNIFSGANNIYITDALSTGITSKRNTVD